MPLRVKLQLVVMADNNEVCIDDVVVLDRQHERLEHVGLSLAEAKTLLLKLQRQLVRIGSTRTYGTSSMSGSSRTIAAHKPTRCPASSAT
jgi:hypothetical protein